MNREEMRCIGYLAKSHGVRGELSLSTELDSLSLEDYPHIFCEIDGLLVPYRVESYRPNGRRGLLVSLRWITDADSAGKLVHRSVYYPIAACGEVAVGTKWELLEGYVIADESTDWTGIITGIDASTANILFRVDHDGREILIPASDSLIVLIDENRKRVIMKIPEGLWDL